MSPAATADTVEKEAKEEPAVNGASPVVRILGRDDILAAPDLQTQVVDVPEWGGSVIVQGLTGVDRDYFERSMLDIKGDNAAINWRNFRAKLVARAVVDSEGRRLFLETDVDALGKKSAKALQRVFRVAQELSGLADDEVEELTEGLKDVPSEDSGSG